MPSIESFKKEGNEIPDAEKADMASSPVTKEEMHAAVEALNDKQEEKVVEKSPSLLPMTPEEIEKDSFLHRKRSELTEAERERRDAFVIEELRKVMKEGTPKVEEESKLSPPETPADGNNGGDEDPDHIVMHEGRADIKREVCPKCGGKGKRFLFFTCWKCSGLGTVGIHKGMKWTSKIIKKKPSNRPDAFEPTPEMPAESPEVRQDEEI